MFLARKKNWPFSILIFFSFLIIPLFIIVQNNDKAIDTIFFHQLMTVNKCHKFVKLLLFRHQFMTIIISHNSKNCDCYDQS